LELVERLEEELRRLNRRAGELKRPVCIREDVDPMKVLRRYVELQDEIGSMREKLREARRRFGPRRIRRGEFGRMKVQIGKLERKRRALPCNKCPYRKSCLPLYKAVAEVEAQRRMIRDRKKEAERGLKERIARRLDVLWDLGYIDEEGLLPRGRFASQIYGYEMQVTQLFFGGHFERLSEDQINVLIMAIVFESKKDEWFAKLRDKEIKRMLSRAKSEVEFIRQCELKHNIADLTPQLDDSFSAAMLAWSQVSFKTFAATPRLRRRISSGRSGMP